MIQGQQVINIQVLTQKLSLIFFCLPPWQFLNDLHDYLSLLSMLNYEILKVQCSFSSSISHVLPPAVTHLTVGWHGPLPLQHWFVWLTCCSFLAFWYTYSGRYGSPLHYCLCHLLPFILFFLSKTCKIKQDYHHNRTAKCISVIGKSVLTSTLLEETRHN